jgi:hypothetical protein
VFAPISVLLAGLFLLPVLPNGIQLVEVPPQGDSVEIVAGYASGGLTSFPSINAARPLQLAAYAAGGDLKFFNELDRTGLRITVPRWAAPMFTDELAAIFKEIPAAPTDAAARNDDFRSKVEAEVREALIGSASQPAEYATDRAFVLFPGPVPNALRESLAAIPNRPSKARPDVTANRLAAERTLRFKSDLELGGVVFAAPTPAIFYKEWYSILLLDRVIRRLVPLRITSELQLTTHPYYYRLEVRVPAGQFPEPVEDTLMQELQRLQFSRAEPSVLDQAKSDARTYLESKQAMEWFASAGIPERRTEGIEWIQAMTADDVRVAARDLLLANRVLATWSPKVNQTAVEVGDLRASGQGVKPSSASLQRPLSEGTALPIPAFPQHSDSSAKVSAPEKLPSGVSLVASSISGVFVSGGGLTKYDKEPDTDTLRAFQMYRPDRILVLAPPQTLDNERRLWGTFQGNAGGNAGLAKGNVSAGDLPALAILRILIDRKVIEAGWSNDVEIKISASEGSMLTISADADKRARIVEWIKQLGMEKPGDTEMAWAHEVAIHRFGLMEADLQALTWERDPQGTLQDLETVSSGHVSDVARIYF